MSFAPVGNFDLDPLFEILEILKLEDIYNLELAKFTYKDKNNLLPINLAKYFEIRQIQNNVRTRSRPNDSVQIVHNSTIGLKSVRLRCDDIWKVVPSEIKSLPWLNSFKRRYKSHLLLLNFN